MQEYVQHRYLCLLPGEVAQGVLLLPSHRSTGGPGRRDTGYGLEKPYQSVPQETDGESEERTAPRVVR